MSDEQIQREADRAAKLMEGLARACYEASEKREGEENFRFETVGIVNIVTWEDGDGNQREDVAFAFETKRHHVKTGILHDTLAAHLQRSQGGDE